MPIKVAEYIRQLIEDKRSEDTNVGHDDVSKEYIKMAEHSLNDLSDWKEKEAVLHWCAYLHKVDGTYIAVPADYYEEHSKGMLNLVSMEERSKVPKPELRKEARKKLPLPSKLKLRRVQPRTTYNIPWPIHILERDEGGEDNDCEEEYEVVKPHCVGKLKITFKALNDLVEYQYKNNDSVYKEWCCDAGEIHDCTEIILKNIKKDALENEQNFEIEETLNTERFKKFKREYEKVEKKMNGYLRNKCVLLWCQFLRGSVYDDFKTIGIEQPVAIFKDEGKTREYRAIKKIEIDRLPRDDAPNDQISQAQTADESAAIDSGTLSVATEASQKYSQPDAADSQISQPGPVDESKGLSKEDEDELMNMGDPRSDDDDSMAVNEEQVSSPPSTSNNHGSQSQSVDVKMSPAEDTIVPTPSQPSENVPNDPVSQDQDIDEPPVDNESLRSTTIATKEHPQSEASNSQDLQAQLGTHRRVIRKWMLMVMSILTMWRRSVTKN
jgi:hypothetical protein